MAWRHFLCSAACFENIDVRECFVETMSSVLIIFAAASWPCKDALTSSPLVTNFKKCGRRIILRVLSKVLLVKVFSEEEAAEPLVSSHPEVPRKSTRRTAAWGTLHRQHRLPCPRSADPLGRTRRYTASASNKETLKFVFRYLCVHLSRLFGFLYVTG